MVALYDKTYCCFHAYLSRQPHADVREAAKNSFSSSGPTTKRGGGPTNKKNNFFEALIKKSGNTSGGTFFAASLIYTKFYTTMNWTIPWKIIG